MTLGKKIATACAGLVGLSALTGAAASYGLYRMKATTHRLASGPVTSNYLTGRMDSNAQGIALRMSLHIMADNPLDAQQLETEIADLEKIWREAKQDYEQLAVTAD